MIKSYSPDLDGFIENMSDIRSDLIQQEDNPFTALLDFTIRMAEEFKVKNPPLRSIEDQLRDIGARMPSGQQGG